MAAILRIALGALMLAVADWNRLAAAADPHPTWHYALHVLWLAGGIVIGDGLWRLGRGMPRAKAPQVESR